MAKVQILAVLNERGYKTPIGGKFSYSGLVAYCAMLRAKTDIPVKKKYRGQLKEALEIGEGYIKEEGMTKMQVVSLLNERGYETKTGKAISYGVFLNEWTIYKNR